MGSVCGLGIIAVVSVYLFWFRPKQQGERKDGKEQDETGLTTISANDPQMPDIEKSYEVDIKYDLQQKPIEMQHMPSELSSPIEGAELPENGSGIAEVPGDKGGFELPPESHPVELPGDHEYQSSASSRSDR